jgi:hypothetical protein
MTDNHGCPAEIVESLKRYVEHKIAPGNFLTSVLRNDLVATFNTADEDNRLLLLPILAFIWWELPSDCWGSAEKVEKWLKG